MKFCANCAAEVVRRVPPGDTLERWVCDQCGEIHYQNPKMVVGPAFSLISVPAVNQVHVFYLARLRNLEFKPGEESLEVGLFQESDIPWKEIAFRTVATTLRLWF